MNAKRVGRNLIQFRLSWLFGAITLASILFAFIAWEIRMQREAAEAHLFFEQKGATFLDKVGNGINLENSNVTVEDLKTITKLRSLRALILRNTAVDDDSLRFICQCRDLVYLDLRDTDVSSGGIDRLRRDLPYCHVEVGQQSGRESGE